MASSSKGGGQTLVTKYSATVLYALCWGKVDAFRAFRIGEKLALGTNIEGPRTMNIAKPALHGGLMKEGGVEGSVIFMDGRKDQRLPARLVRRIYKGQDPSPDQHPGYRGVACAALTGYWVGDAEYPEADGSDLNYSEGTSLADAINGHWQHVPPGTAAFYIGANNPYLKDVSFDVLRASDDWFPERSLVYRDSADRTLYEAGTPISKIKGFADSNLVHVMYEAITNMEWGAGVPSAALHETSWRAAAQAAYDETLGGSFLWSDTKPVKNLIADISDHVRCMFFRDPDTLKLGLVLVRGDYDVNNLREFDEDNSELTSSSVVSPTGVANEISVEWTDPVGENLVSVTAQNLAGIRRTGEIEPEQRSYSFFRREDLAFSAATRDVLAASTPLTSVVLQVPPGNLDIKTGDVVSVNYPENGIDRVPMRVMRVMADSRTDSSRQLELLQDVFSLPGFSQTVREAATSEPDSVEPFDSVIGSTAPMYLKYRLGLPQTDDEFVVVLASHSQSGTFGATLMEVLPGPVGTEPREVGEVALSPRGTLPTTLEFGSTTLDYDLGVMSQGAPVLDGDFVAIGDGSDSGTEIALVTEITNTGVSLRRGVMDTDPRKHPPGTSYWVLSRDARYVQSTPRVAAETVQLDALPLAFFGTGDSGQPENQLTYSVIPRSLLPIRPANVQIAGDLYAGIDSSVAVSGTVQISWSNRNRLLEDGTLLSWDESTIAPEAGQTTTIRVRKDGTVVAEFTGLTGTSFGVDFSGVPAGQAVLEVSSARDGLESLVSVDRTVFVV